MIEAILSVTIIFLIIIIYLLFKKMALIREELAELKSKYKSKAVLHGSHWENFVPFTEQFEKIADKENAKFLGKPIDYIVFDDDAIKFVEVKTGQSRLSEKEKHIREQIKNKEIKWFELRF